MVKYALGLAADGKIEVETYQQNESLDWTRINTERFDNLGTCLSVLMSSLEQKTYQGLEQTIPAGCQPLSPQQMDLVEKILKFYQKINCKIN